MNFCTKIINKYNKNCLFLITASQSTPTISNVLNPSNVDDSNQIIKSPSQATAFPSKYLRN